MRRILILLPLIALISCSNDPNQEYIDKVAEKVKKNDMGLDIGYRNVEFAWIDTIYVDDYASEYHAENTYRMMIGEIDQEIKATVIFDRDFEIVDIK
jgi:hypothetical protein